MEAKDVLARMRAVSDNLKASIRDARDQRKALDVKIEAKLEDQILLDDAIREIEATLTQKDAEKKDDLTNGK